jgi:cellulose synthase/poly-beta-1,6-N-acetylglucosamine synthase-like glycosyltransferase
MIALIYVDVSLVLFLVIRKLGKKERDRLQELRDGELVLALNAASVPYRGQKLIESFKSLKENIILGHQASSNVQSAVNLTQLERHYLRKLRSRKNQRRIDGAVHLALIASDSAREALEEALSLERDFPVKLYIANALADIKDPRSLPHLVDSLINGHRWYRDKVNMLICSFDEAFYEFIPTIAQRPDHEIKELIVDFSEEYISDYLLDYLLNMLDGMEERIAELEKEIAPVRRKKACLNCQFGKRSVGTGERVCPYHGVVGVGYYCRKYLAYPASFMMVDNYKRLAYRAGEVLRANYYKELDQDKYLHHSDTIIRRIAISALAKQNTVGHLDKLTSALKDPDVADAAIKASVEFLQLNPHYFRRFFNHYCDSCRVETQIPFLEVMSYRIEYLIMRLATDMSDQAYTVIKDILISGKVSQFIWFMNENTDPEVESILIRLVREVSLSNPEVEHELNQYLDPELVEKAGIGTGAAAKEGARHHLKDESFRFLMYLLVGFLVAVFPVLFLIRHGADLFVYDWQYNLRTYVVDFNYYLVYYSLMINAVYVTLLLAAMRGAKKQIALWNFKSKLMLFKKKMLPTVSIIAPAYNEEKTIIESVNSLLNLEYPDYELIVVNDGSSDKTLEVLVRNFALDRRDIVYETRLRTKLIRGVYSNPSIPKLLVLDKENGGKADALNAGINAADGEYFCGIDADSMLEKEALLRLASLTVDAGIEVPAIGGNVLPVNGCTVDKGSISDVRVPRKRIARFQMVEYVRAFMTGRLGWSNIDSLLIISGAFGLFRRERIIAVGGYLASEEKYNIDTVGEDMELVVRTRRFMHEHKLKYKLGFGFDANCWTQVPEDRPSLKRQRQRWNRGLADTMAFHRKLLFNPRYGRTGLIGMPYFFTFELAGPVVELQGYLMVVIAIIFGYLNREVALMLFVTTVFIGVFVSLSSFLILERSHTDLRIRDVLLLMIYAIFENFGPRQLSVVWRAGAVFRLLRKSEGWGSVSRQRFQPHEKRQLISDSKVGA